MRCSLARVAIVSALQLPWYQYPCAAHQGLQGVVWCEARRLGCALSPLSQASGLLTQGRQWLLILGRTVQMLDLLEGIIPRHISGVAGHLGISEFMHHELLAHT
jgi:hypothetical protein